MTPLARIAALASLLTVVACGDSTGPEINLTGNWSISDNSSNAQLFTSCTGTGTASINQTGNSFTGSYDIDALCTDPNGSYDGSNSGAITGGQISGNNVSFVVGACSYEGSVVNANRLSGTSACDVAFFGTTYRFTGNSQASR